MRTAEEILQNLGLDHLEFLTSDHFRITLKAINEARKEAIEECAEIALPQCDRYEPYAIEVMNKRKQSILSLINEIQ